MIVAPKYPLVELVLRIVAPPLAVQRDEIKGQLTNVHYTWYDPMV
jgi:hypothetical protein